MSRFLRGREQPPNELVSEVALSRVDVDALTVGRSRRLKAQGAPRGLRVIEVSR